MLIYFCPKCIYYQSLYVKVVVGEWPSLSSNLSLSTVVNGHESDNLRQEFYSIMDVKIQITATNSFDPASRNDRSNLPAGSPAQCRSRNRLPATCCLVSNDKTRQVVGIHRLRTPLSKIQLSMSEPCLWWETHSAAKLIIVRTILHRLISNIPGCFFL